MKCKKCGHEIEQTKWIKIPELKIEVEQDVHDKGKCLKDIKIPKGYRIPTYFELQWLRNSKYCEQLNLIDTWEFVEQPDNIAKEKGYVAGFLADSVRADLNCYRYPQNACASLGVRFVRRMKK